MDKLDHLSRLNAQAPHLESGTTVLLDTHVKDQGFAFELAGLLDQHGVQPFFYQETGDAMEGFEKQLAGVEKLVVLFGAVTPEWVVERVNTAFQFVASKLGQASLREFYVLVVPPEKAPPRFLPIVEKTVQVVDCSASAGLKVDAVAAILGASP